MASQFYKERMVFLTDGVGQLVIHIHTKIKKELRFLPHTIYEKINSKLILDLNVRVKTFKILEHIGVILYDLGVGMFGGF